MCDGCLAAQLEIQTRQIVNTLCRKLSAPISRTKGTCAGCSKAKTLNALGSDSEASSPVIPKSRKAKSRSQALSTRLNAALISVFLLERRDYFSELTFAQLLELKQGLARIHDAVTLKLTFQLVHWIAERFHLRLDQKAALWKQVDDQSTNAAGFDLQWNQPPIIAEVKGCIPNGGDQQGHPG